MCHLGARTQHVVSLENRAAVWCAMSRKKHFGGSKDSYDAPNFHATRPNAFVVVIARFSCFPTQAPLPNALRNLPMQCT